MGGNGTGPLRRGVDALNERLPRLRPEIEDAYARAAGIFATRAAAYGTRNIAEGGPASVFARIRDKLSRAERLLESGQQESAVDTALDLANYGIILSCLFSNSWPDQGNLECKVVGKGICSPQHPGDVGYDLKAAEEVTLLPGRLTYIRTNVRLQMPPGVWCRIAGRSGLMREFGIIVPDNVIDNGYRGPLDVALLATGATVRINVGDRIAQVVFYHSCLPEIKFVNELEPTERGSRGFGSTGC